MKLMGRKPKLSADQVARLREWAANRMTATEFARQLGIAPTTLHAYLRGERKNYREAA